jgi:hypothetical protein
MTTLVNCINDWQEEYQIKRVDNITGIPLNGIPVMYLFQAYFIFYCPGFLPHLDGPCTDIAS